MKDSPRIVAIDGLRGIAISLVVFWHYIICTIPLDESLPQYVLKAARSPLWLSWSGVDLFFVLSGYLIGGVLLDARESPRYFRTFYTRRAARILPLYFFVLGVAALAYWAHPRRLGWLLGGPPVGLWVYAVFGQTLTMITRATLAPHFLSVTWSLAVEEHFYLLAPLAVRLVARRALPWLFGAAIALAPLLRLWLLGRYPSGSGYYANLLMPARLDALGLGMLAAYGLRVPACREWLGRRGPALAVIASLLGLGVLALGAVGARLYSPLITTVGYPLFALFYLSLLLLVVTQPDGRMAALCRLRGLTELGRLCFGVYLWHEIVLGACHGMIFGRNPVLADLEDFWITLLSFLLTLLLARASFRWFERPFIERSHRLSY